MNLISGSAVSFLLAAILATPASATIIEDLIGEVKLAPVAIGLDFAGAATAIDGVLHVAGRHDGQAARQLVDLTTGIVGQIELFESLASSISGTGDPGGSISEVVATEFGALYLGETAGTFDSSQATYWLEPSAPQGGVNSFGQPASGFLVGASQTGVMIGSIQAAVYGSVGDLPQVLPGPFVGTTSDISNDARYITSIEGAIWESNGVGGYQGFSTAGFDFSESGGTPSWIAVAIDPVVGDAVFAGTYFNLNTFEEELGFWRADGTFLGAFAGVVFSDFEVYDGQLVAALEGAADSLLLAITDFSTIALADILGVESIISQDGLFFGSFGFLASGVNGSFVSSRFLSNENGGGTDVPEPGSLLLLGSSLLWGVRRSKKGHLVC